MEQKSSKPKKNNFLTFLYWVAAIALLMECSKGYNSAPFTQEEKKEHKNKMNSLYICVESQIAVKKFLKAPSTAKFPDCSFNIHEYEIRGSEEENLYYSFGHVDSQNSFGAMIRSDFAVKLKKEGDRFYAIDVAIE